MILLTKWIFLINLIHICIPPGPFFVVPLSDTPPDATAYEELCANDPYFHYNYDGPQTSVYLFDLDTDPTENYNLADKYPDVVDIMLGKLARYESETVPYVQLPIDCDSFPEGVFRPWGDNVS